MYTETEYRVIFADTDAMGIVYNGSYVNLMERGRTEFLRQIGYPYSRMEAEGLALPVSAIVCEYKAPAFADDLLVIKSWVRTLKSASVEMGYEIYKKDTGEVCAVGASTHPVTDAQLRPVRFKKVRPDIYELIAATMDDDNQPRKRLRRG